MAFIETKINPKTQILIDLNCDLAQSYGVYKNSSEQALLPFVSSVNISCGLHAGDPLTIARALQDAKDRNISIGAHIGYPDIQGFGYRQMQLSDEEIKAIVLYQIGALTALAKTYNVEISHVRPHGALYQDIATNKEVALSVAKAIHSYSPWMILVGAYSKMLDEVSEETNLRVAHEIQLDKVYKEDGSIDFDAEERHDLEYATSLINTLINTSSVRNTLGGATKVKVNSIHLNTRSQHSREIARRAKDLIQKPVPVFASIVKESSLLF